MNEFTENIANPGPGSAREPGVGIGIAIRNGWGPPWDRFGPSFHAWGEDLKPEGEGITAEEQEFLGNLDSNGELL